jgi:hypothetical protein
MSTFVCLAIPVDHNLVYERLKQLLQKAMELHPQKQAINKVRQMQAGGGRKPKLSAKEPMILTNYAIEPLLSFGIQFFCGETTADDIFYYWPSISAEWLTHGLPERARKTGELKNCARRAGHTRKSQVTI